VAGSRLALFSLLLFLPACDGAEPPVCGEGEQLVPVGQPDSDEATEVCAPADCGTVPYASASGTVLHVAPWGGTTGPGTLEQPYGILQRALTAASPGTTILVSDGTFAWDLLATSEEGTEVTIQGRCPELTVVTPGDPSSPSLEVQGATLALAGLTIQDGQGVHMARSADGQQDADVTLTDVVVADSQFVGLQAVSGTRLQITDSVIRGTRISDEGSTSAAGLVANTGARVTITGTTFTGNMGTGIEARGQGTTLTLDDVTIRDGVAMPFVEPPEEDHARWHGDVMSGFAILAENGAAVTATGLQVLDNPGYGITLQGPAGPHHFEDLVIRGQRDAYPPPYNAGASGGSALIIDSRWSGQMDVTGSNILIEDAEWMGIGAFGEFVNVDFEDVTIRDIKPESHYGGGGIGLVGSLDAPVAIRNLVIEDTSDNGVLAAFGSHVALTDVVITNVRAGLLPGGGIGMAAWQDGFLDVDGVRIEGTVGATVAGLPGSETHITNAELIGGGMAGVVSLGATMEISDSTITGATPSASYGGGVGVFAYAFQERPRVVLDNVTLTDTIGPGAYLRGGGSYEIRNSTFSDSGDVRGVPGGVFAAEGVAAWSDGVDDEPGDGLLLEDNTFTDIAMDAVLLDNAGATLAGNTFSGVSGEPLFVQRCAITTHDVVVDGQSNVDASCRDEARIIESLLLYSMYVDDAVAH